MFQNFMGFQSQFLKKINPSKCLGALPCSGAFLGLLSTKHIIEIIEMLGTKSRLLKVLWSKKGFQVLSRAQNRVLWHNSDKFIVQISYITRKLNDNFFKWNQTIIKIRKIADKHLVVNEKTININIYYNFILFLHLFPKNSCSYSQCNDCSIETVHRWLFRRNSGNISILLFSFIYMRLSLKGVRYLERAQTTWVINCYE